MTAYEIDITKDNLINLVRYEFNKLWEYSTNHTKTGIDKNRFKLLFNYWEICANKSEPIEKYYIEAHKILHQKRTSNEKKIKDNNGNIRTISSRTNIGLKKYRNYCKATRPINFELHAKKHGAVCRIKAIYNKKDVAELIRAISDKYQLKAFSKDNFKLLEKAKNILKTGQDIQSEIFRRSGPIESDFNAGNIFINNDFIKALYNDLENERVVVLTGSAASGKTVLGRLIAREWLKDNPVMFLDVAKKKEIFDVSNLETDIWRLNQRSPKTLLIIEDAHLKIFEINDFIFNFKINYTSLFILVITRDHYDKMLKNDINNFSAYKPLNLNFKDQKGQIVKYYFKRHGWKKNNDIKDRLLSEFGDNLWILSYALESLIDSDGKELSEQKIIKKVEKDLEKIGQDQENGPLRIRLLLALSVLARFEIKTDIKYLYQRFSSNQSSSTPINKYKIESALNELYKIGEATLSDDKKFYGIPHTVIADFFFYFTYAPESKWLEDAYKNENEYISSYIVSNKVSNGLDLIRASSFSLKDEKELIESVVWKTAFIDKLVNELDIINIRDSLFLIGSMSPKIQKLFFTILPLEILVKNILQSNNIIYICSCIWTVFNLCPEEYAEKFWKNIKKGLCDIFNKESNLVKLGSCLSYVFELSKDTGEEFWADIDQGSLIKKLDRSDDSKQKIKCLSSLLRIGKDEFKEKISPIINLNTLLQKSIGSSNIHDIKIISCRLYITINDSSIGLEELWNEKIKAFFLDMVHKSPVDIFNVIDFLCYFYNTSPEISCDIWNRFKKENVATRLFFNKNANLFFDRSGNRRSQPNWDGKICSELWETIDNRKKKKIGKTILNYNDAHQISHCIKQLHSFHDKAGEEILHTICAKIAKKIESLDAFNCISEMVVNCAISPQNEVEILWKNTKKMIFRRRMLLSSVKFYEDFTIFHIIYRLRNISNSLDEKSDRIDKKIMLCLGNKNIDMIEKKIQELIELGDAACKNGDSKKNPNLALFFYKGDEDLKKILSDIKEFKSLELQYRPDLIFFIIDLMEKITFLPRK